MTTVIAVSIVSLYLFGWVVSARTLWARYTSRDALWTDLFSESKGGALLCGLFWPIWGPVALVCHCCRKLAPLLVRALMGDLK